MDLDAIAFNTRQLVQAADQNGLNLYMMTKQIGRNPEVAKLIAANGIERAVAVDPWEAHLWAGRASPWERGHLVQIPPPG